MAKVSENLLSTAFKKIPLNGKFSLFLKEIAALSLPRLDQTYCNRTAQTSFPKEG